MQPFLFAFLYCLHYSEPLRKKFPTVAEKVSEPLRKKFPTVTEGFSAPIGLPLLFNIGNEGDGREEAMAQGLVQREAQSRCHAEGMLLQRLVYAANEAVASLPVASLRAADNEWDVVRIES